MILLICLWSSSIYDSQDIQDEKKIIDERVSNIARHLGAPNGSSPTSDDPPSTFPTLPYTPASWNPQAIRVFW